MAFKLIYCFFDLLKRLPMTGIKVLLAVQFITIRGRRFAVFRAEAWEELVEWLETIEDTAIATECMAQLKESSGDRAKVGWIKWSDVLDEFE